MRCLVLLTVLACCVPVAADDKPIRVAVYTDKGTSTSLKNLFAALDGFPDVKYDKLSGDDVRAGKLTGSDLALFPGGSGGGQGKALGEDGRKQVKTFVEKGGGYLGICAGSYLASTSYPWSLHILNAEVVDRAHWARGFGPVELQFTDAGKARLAGKDGAAIYYHQGPLLAPAKAADLPAYEPWATFRTEIAKNGAPKGVMKGTTAVAAAQFGKGRVVCFSPHPEKEEATRPMLRKALRWVVER